MADRVLPTPVEVRDYLKNNPPVPLWMSRAIVKKYAADEFVDREAIDYEAAKEYLRSVGENYHFAKETVDAALGVTDER